MKMEYCTLTKPSNHFLNIIIFTLVVSLTCTYSAPASSTSSTISNYTNFVNKSCNVTTYPTLCVKTLTPYASSVKTNSFKLCNTALNVAIQATNNCSATVSKLAKQKSVTSPEASAIKDCVGDMKDVVYELKETLKDMGHLDNADREFQWANAKTAASAAITDAETCVDGLGKNANPAVKKKIKNCVSLVEPLISNALALINHLY